MPRRPQLRFLLRASLLLAAALLVWWILLLDPLRAGLRLLAVGTLRLIPGDGSVAAATVEPNGDWSLRLPVPPSIAAREPIQRMFGRISPAAPRVTVRSLRLTLKGKYPVLFTAGLPFYWALVLAAGWTRRTLRVLLVGSAALAVMAVISLDFYAMHLAIVNTRLVDGGTANFLLECGEYVVMNVVPYVGPLLLAVCLHTELRALIFSREAVPVPAGPSRPARGRKRR